MRTNPKLASKIRLNAHQILGICDNPRAVLAMIRAAKYDNIAAGKPSDKRFDVLGSNGHIYSVNPSSSRYQVFEISLACANCNRVGEFMALSRDRASATDHAHFNLLAADGELMTQDHVYPRSAGGPNAVHNLQTMCQPCNRYKGSSIPEGQPAPVMCDRRPLTSLEVFLKSIQKHEPQRRNNLIRFGLKELLVSKAEREKLNPNLKAVPTDEEIIRGLVSIIEDLNPSDSDAEPITHLRNFWRRQ